MRIFNWKVIVDSVQAWRETRAIEKKAHDVERKISTQQVKAAMVWSYINQLATMSLTLLNSAAKGTKIQTNVQRLVAGLQIAQTELAVAQAVAQAMAFAGSGSFGRAAFMYAIAAMMQINVTRGMILRAQAQKLESRAAAITKWYDAYG